MRQNIGECFPAHNLYTNPLKGNSNKGTEFINSAQCFHSSNSSSSTVNKKTISLLLLLPYLSTCLSFENTPSCLKSKKKKLQWDFAISSLAIFTAGTLQCHIMSVSILHTCVPHPSLSLYLSLCLSLSLSLSLSPATLRLASIQTQGSQANCHWRTMLVVSGLRRCSFFFLLSSCVQKSIQNVRSWRLCEFSIKGQVCIRHGIMSLNYQNKSWLFSLLFTYITWGKSVFMRCLSADIFVVWINQTCRL